MKVKLIHITPDVENVISYCARVSNPKNQSNYNTASKLLKYCIKHKHWSIFEMGSMCIEIETSRAIAAQILRHRSFSFQEWSQRYSDSSTLGFELYRARRQDAKNRQNSIDDLNPLVAGSFELAQQFLYNTSKVLYKGFLKMGVAKESARFLLPLNTSTRFYMHGNIRSWLHFIELRTGNGTQKEHMEIAEECKKIFIKEMPNISEALGWK